MTSISILMIKNPRNART